MRRLIINADDLGLTAGVNRAIFQSHAKGVVTSATLMPTGAALQDAVAALQANPTLSVGCHLVVVDGTPLSPARDVPSLLNGKPEFRQTIGQLAIAARGGKLSASEIQLEAGAQFRRLQSLGVRLSHFDSHKHAHMFPEILRPVLAAATDCGIRAVRNPFEGARPLPFSYLFRYPRLMKRYLQVAALRSMRSHWKSLVEASGLVTTDGSLGVVVTGDLDETLLAAILAAMPGGTWELVCHPGYDDPELANVRTRLRQSRPKELAVLTSDTTRRLIERLGIELISYAEL